MKAAATKSRSTQSWRVTQTMTGDLAYKVSSGFESWEQFAVPLPNMKEAYGDKESKRLNDLLRSSVTHISRAVYTIRPDLSRMFPDNTPTPAVVQRMYISVKPGMNAQWENVVHKIVAAAAASPQKDSLGAHWIIAEPGAGAEGRYLIINLSASWAEYGNGDGVPLMLAKQYGEAEAELLWSQLTSASDNVETVIGRPRPELELRSGN